MKKQTREQKLRKELVKLNKEYKEKEKSIKEIPECISLKKKEKALGKKSSQLYEKEKQIEDEIKFMYLDNTGEPCYKTSSSEYGAFSERNIRPEVLSSIKRTLGITNLSHLRASQINKATQKLIDLEMGKSEELKKVREEYDKVTDEKEVVIKKIDDFEDGLDDLYNKKWDVERELNRIKEAKERLKDRKNPEKVSKIKKLEKEEEAQRKMSGINLEELRVEITKEKIINNLEDENEED